MPRCPQCLVVPKDGTFPPDKLGPDDDWWCTPCLNSKLRKAIEKCP